VRLGGDLRAWAGREKAVAVGDRAVQVSVWWFGGRIGPL
jgi:hypothetical protein